VPRRRRVFVKGRTRGPMEILYTTAFDRVVHVDADPLWRFVVQDRLARLPDCTCESFVSLGELQAAAQRGGPVRLAVVEPSHQGCAVYHALRHCVASSHRVLVLTGERCEIPAALMPRSRIAGVLYKHGFSDLEFWTAWREIAAGRTYFAPDFTRRLKQEEKSVHALRKYCSPRELSLLPFVALGYSDDRIAAELALSHWTIKNHRSSLLRKTGFASSRELIAWASANGFGP